VLGLGIALIALGGLTALYPLPFGDGGSCGSLLFRHTVRGTASADECPDIFHDRLRLVMLSAGLGILLLGANCALAFRRARKKQRRG